MGIAPARVQLGTQTKLARWGQAWTKVWHGAELLDTGLCTGPDEDKAGLLFMAGQIEMRLWEPGGSLQFPPK